MRGIATAFLACAMVGSVEGGARFAERLERGIVAIATPDGKAHVMWRLLADDPPGIAFNLYRTTDGKTTRLNAEPLKKTTDFLDAPTKPCSYYVRPVVGGKEGRASRAANFDPRTARPYLSIKLEGNYTFQKVGIADLDGDGRYDFIIKQPNANIDPYIRYWRRSPDTYKLEAWTPEGKLLWRYDLGWAIERGIWYSPYLVFDLDGDGKAEVAAKTGEGDPRDPEGRVTKGPEYLTILDGLTGKVRAQTDWPPRSLFKGSRAYNYASRNQLGVAYLDGKTPALIVERGTYNIIVVVAYEFRNGRLGRLWRWCNDKEPRKYWGQGAHWMHCADLDADGRDEVLIGSAAIDHDGKSLWATGLGHPDHCYVGEIDPSRPGLEVYYGLETRQKKNGMCLVDARTGAILWGYPGPTRHVHSHGMCSDIDPRHPGAECFSTDTDPQKKPAWSRLWSARGEVLSKEMTWGFGPLVAYWDADPQREIVFRGRIQDYRGATHPPRLEGRVVAVADILGDWREEIITSVPGELRIYLSPIPASDRRPSLMQDPLYRNDVAHATMGYYQVPMLGRDLASEE